jgi:uncharacterized integral membrane protein
MGSTRAPFWWTFAILLAVCFCIFGIQNSQNLQVKFLGYTSPNLPLWGHYYLAFLGGVIFTAVLGFAQIFRLKSRLRKSRRTVELLEREVDALRNHPLFDEPPAAPAVRSEPLRQPIAHDGLPEDVVGDVKRRS